jgi:hypothetical protein
MKRSIMAVIAGLATWILVASLLDRGLRALLEGYALAEPKMAFTLGMMAARLILAAVASVAAGAVAGAVAPAGRRMPWVLGVILLAAFLPVHVKLWNVFPVWYHLTFLLSLVPLIVLGALFTQRRAPASGSPVAHA